MLKPYVITVSKPYAISVLKPYVIPILTYLFAFA